MRVLIIVLFFAPAACFFAQGTRVLNPDSLRRDFTILKTSLKENHPFAGTYITDHRFDSISNDILAQIDQGLTTQQFHNNISRLLSQFGCGHTYALPLPEAKKQLNSNNDLPFEVSISSNAVCISKAYVEGFDKYVGGNVTSINNIPIGEILRSATGLISSDGYNMTYKYFRFGKEFSYYINEVLNYPTSLTFQLANDNFTLKFPTGFVKDSEVTASSLFYTLPDNKTVILSLADFDGGKRLIKKCFRYIARINAENLIIDLRNNGGGNGNIGAYLTSFIVDSTTTYYLDKKTHPFIHKECLTNKQGFIISNQFILKDSITKSYFFKVHPRKKNNFNGKLYVLINGGTFSTAAYVASVLKYKTSSVFAGEETGGSEYGIGGGTISTLVLPYSKIGVKFPLYRWRFNTTNEQNGRGVIPFLKTNNACTDSLAHDKVLESVMEVIKKKAAR